MRRVRSSVRYCGSVFGSEQRCRKDSSAWCGQRHDNDDDNEEDDEDGSVLFVTMQRHCTRRSPGYTIMYTGSLSMFSPLRIILSAGIRRFTAGIDDWTDTYENVRKSACEDLMKRRPTHTQFFSHG